MGDLEIRGCYGCPFEYDTMDCTHPGRDRVRDAWDWRVDLHRQKQAWCPLHKGPITIRLATPSTDTGTGERG